MKSDEPWLIKVRWAHLLPQLAGWLAAWLVALLLLLVSCLNRATCLAGAGSTLKYPHACWRQCL